MAPITEGTFIQFAGSQLSTVGIQRFSGEGNLV
jgi:hypothetical protein